MKTLSHDGVHRARGSGRWFPADRGALSRMVEGYLDEAEAPAIDGRIVAGLAPHAGFVYSGAVAGHTFRALRDQARAGGGPETVVVLGFSHRESYRGLALLDADAVATPLGETPIDRDGAEQLTSAGGRIAFANGPHDGEHSAENELPFVQAALPEAALIVGLFGDHDPAGVAETVNGLLALGRLKPIAVVASTDLLHDPDYERVRTTDGETLAAIEAMDEAGLAGRWSYDFQICCGIQPVLAAMGYARALGCRRGIVLRYANSGDDHPESRGHWVVGYGSVVFSAPS